MKSMLSQIVVGVIVTVLSGVITHALLKSFNGGGYGGRGGHSYSMSARR